MRIDLSGSVGRRVRWKDPTPLLAFEPGADENAAIADPSASHETDNWEILASQSLVYGEDNAGGT